jgi:quercetin dioxygenase-like cupin family protein
MDHISMKLINALVLVSAAMGLQSAAFALEPSTGVKAITVLKAQTSWDGNPIVYPQGKPEITGMIVEIAPGGETGWHLHPVNSFGVLLEGELEVVLKNGSSKRLMAGDALAEVANISHNGRSVGAVPAKIIVFYVGEVGQTLSIREPAK